jgi:pyruvate,water dikinase
MHRTIVWLDEMTTRDVALVGHKAAHLGWLSRAGLPVPDGFVVSSAAYMRAAEAAGLRHALSTCSAVTPSQGGALVRRPEDLAAMAARIRLPHDLAVAVCEAYRQLDHHSAAVAVRSSATSRDRDEPPFAGMHAAFTSITGEQLLLDRIRACWASLYSPRVVAYRAARHLTDEPSIAVVVQRMVDADRAGVAFAAGEETAIVVKEGVLCGDETDQVTRLGRQVADVHRRAMEIEWAFAGGELWLLQASPMVSGRGGPRPGPGSLHRSRPGG